MHSRFKMKDHIANRVDVIMDDPSLRYQTDIFLQNLASVILISVFLVLGIYW
jgi:hypothetical protein